MRFALPQQTGVHQKQQVVERSSNVYAKSTDNAQEALIAAANNNQIGQAERLLQVRIVFARVCERLCVHLSLIHI